MNEPWQLNRKHFLLSALFIFTIFILSGLMAVFVVSDKSIDQAVTLFNAALTIEENYLDQIDNENLILAAREEMFNKLDRYSSYYDKRTFEKMDDELTGSYTGIGVTVSEHEDGLQVVSVREDSPAFSSGILSGDIITVVDSVSLKGLSAMEATNILKGSENSIAKIAVYRPVNRQTFEMTVTRKRLDFIHIPFAGLTKDSLVYIRLIDFDAGASDDLKDALDSLVINNPKKPKGIIIDLRNNPGGLFHESYNIANLFLQKDNFIVGTDSRIKWNEENYLATGDDITDNLPMAIIVNRNSASASEIVAGSLRQAQRAILVGDTTFGKGLVQGFVRFPDGDGLKLTISRYFFQGNIFLNEFDTALIDTGHGLVPDYHLDDYQYDYFTTQLENSFIMNDFAIKYQDEIIEAVRSGKFDDIWIDKFVQYVKQSNVKIKSERTEIAEDLKKIALLEKSSSKMLRTVEKIIELSQNLDIKMFYDHAPYIKYRISRIAFQRKFGTYKMYREIVLNNQPVIQKTSKILLNQKL